MTTTALVLRKNDGSEEFTLKANNVKSTISMGVVTKALLGGAASLSGGDPTLAKETYEINGVIRDVDPGDYPNSGTYSNDELGMAEELKRAAKEWQPTQQDKLNEMDYDQGANLRGTVGGLFTEAAVTEDRSSNKPRNYTFTLEWTHYDVYIG